MPTRIKYDRSRKAGHPHSRNSQDAPVAVPEIVQDAVKKATGRKLQRTVITKTELDPTELIMTNITTSYLLLLDNMRRFGHRLPVGLRGKVAVVVANMESIVNGE